MRDVVPSPSPHRDHGGAGGEIRSERTRPPSPADAGTNLAVHDLKNLAGRLTVLLQNFVEHYEDPLFKGSALEALEDTVERLKRLAKDLREHEGRITVKLRVDVNAVVREALCEVRPDLKAGIQLVQAYGELPAIWGDAFLLRRAFCCAMENALEALSGRGILEVSTGLNSRKAVRTLFVQISDNGPGMSEEFLREKLFEPLASTKEDGLGLGVYTIRQVASLHEGTVRISSALGIGTRVRFLLPCHA